MGLYDRLGNLLQGKGRLILYCLGGAIVAAALIGGWVMWSRRKSDEARRAMGRAITIATTPVSATPSGSAPSFSSEQERARKAIEECE